MSLISKVIRSLINGISQQAPSVRLDNQLEGQVNMIPDVAIGLTRRNPVDLKNVIAHDGSRVYTEEHAMFTFTINEQQVAIGIKPDGSVYRFDEDQGVTTVTQVSSVSSYLSYTDKDDLQSIETDDRLVILNRGVEVELDLDKYDNKLTLLNKKVGGIDETASFSSTMDSFYTIGTYHITDADSDFRSHNYVGNVVIWNDDHTDHVVYASQTGTQKSPSHANAKYGVFQKIDGSGAGFSGDISDTVWRQDQPEFITAIINHEMSPEDVRVPDLFHNGKNSFIINRGAGVADATYDLVVGGYELLAEPFDNVTYGNWNDDGDTLDLTGLTFDVNGQTYVVNPVAHTNLGSTKRYYMSVTLDKNKPSWFSGLPIKWFESDGDIEAWAVYPEGIDPDNSGDYIYDDAPSQLQYVSIDGLVTEVPTQVSIASEDLTFRSINSTTNSEQLPTVVRGSYGGQYVDYSETERVIVGWCVYHNLAEDEAQYCYLPQIVDNGDFKGYVTTNALSDEGNNTKEAESFLEALDIVNFEYYDTADVRAIRNGFMGTIPVMNGTVDIYSYRERELTLGSFGRSLVWLTSAFDDATYSAKWHYARDNDTVLSFGSIKIASGATPNTPESLLLALKVQMEAAVVTHSLTDVTFYIKGNSLIVRGFNLGKIEVSCDFGKHIYSVSEATILNDAVLDDPTKLPSLPPLDALNTYYNFQDNVTTYVADTFLVRINPDITDELSSYYLKYSDDYDAWIEVAMPFIDTVDRRTMPVSILKRSTNDLQITHTKIVYPLAGDTKSNPHPSFLNKKLKDLIVFNGRLGYASEDTLVFSVINDFFNLYRTTTSSFLISDVVDLTLDSSKLGYRAIDNVFIMDNNLIINTGISQSVLAIPTNLDISKAIFAQVSAFDLGNAVPLAVRRSMYFPIFRGNFSTVKSFTPDAETGIGYTDNSVTKHCEKYIRGNVIQTIFTNDVYIVRTDYDPKTLYIQHTYVTEGQVFQNAWHKWTFKYDVKFIYSQGETLKMVFEDNTNAQTIYGDMNLTPIEIIADTETQIGYAPYLDFNTTDTDLSDLLDDVITVDKALGKLVTSGDANSLDGTTYPSSFTLSEIVPRTEDNQGLTKLGYAILMLRRMSLSLGLSGGATITVSRTSRADYTHNYVPSVIGSIVIGREEVTNESARFPVNGRSQDTRVKIAAVDAFTPLQALSVEWQGQLITKGGR